jgi:hypothetical protein
MIASIIGLGIGVIAVIGAVVGVILFLRRNKNIETKIDNSITTITDAANKLGK